MNRRGQSLVEFALVALALYLILAAILTFGHALYVAQNIQSTADVLAREISRVPLPAGTESLQAALDILARDDMPLIELEMITARQDFRNNVYNEDLLIFNPSDVPSGVSLRRHIETEWPIVNQMLSVVMINDGTTFRYPGVVKDPPGKPPGHYIARTLDLENFDWIPIIEEVGAEVSASSFSVSSPQRGLVALRINYPFQAAAMSAMEPVEEWGEPNAGRYIEVDPSEFDEEAPEVLFAPKELYGGEYGLGRQYAWGRQVRPYRRVLTGQAVYRREVFSGP
jgi:hypothetical protein